MPYVKWVVSTRSRPKAAGQSGHHAVAANGVSTRSRPKAAVERGWDAEDAKTFQHAAARRRLGADGEVGGGLRCFNTQPPEGGCFTRIGTRVQREGWFQHAAARRRLLNPPTNTAAQCPFQHAAARRRLQGKAVHFQSYEMFQHAAARRRLMYPIGF